MIEKMSQTSALYLLRRMCLIELVCWLDLETREIVEDKLVVSRSSLVSLYYGESQVQIQES